MIIDLKLNFSLTYLVYPDGRVCISILHPPGDDERSGESAGERWMPSQTVTSVIISLISMLNDPNFSSPANVDASVECRNNKTKYLERIKKLVTAANEVNSDVVIPHPDTNPEERMIFLERIKEKESADFQLWNDDFNDFDMGEGIGNDFSLSEMSDDFFDMDEAEGFDVISNNDEMEDNTSDDIKSADTDNQDVVNPKEGSDPEDTPDDSSVTDDRLISNRNIEHHKTMEDSNHKSIDDPNTEPVSKKRKLVDLDNNVVKKRKISS
eukprot:TRINITY_DN3031_c0_g1_i2.p1 TRINITY_DN3031_c0_g1~~TRINITY_DN3031_c0_g1_i2.p1  ORF type:complete len:267 (+),score=79.77 TRINITY_DN3031_c0_g1_i2:457-1257(+)